MRTMMKESVSVVSGKASVVSALPSFKSDALTFDVEAQCSVTKARVARLSLPHSVIETPVFMPVGTSATLKGVLPEQLKTLGCQIMLSNTYHLGTRPGADLVEQAGGVHSFMNWNRSVLTDSGGFQMVSLCKLSRVDEEGVSFQSPYSLKPMAETDNQDSKVKDNRSSLSEDVDSEKKDEMLMTPEKSIEIQTKLGADIMMQLDDVVHVLTKGPRVEEAMWRSIRWLDRCIEAHKNIKRQNLFAIIQGGLDPALRKKCCDEMIRRNLPGYAIGGLSGGEEKADFWKVVDQCTDHLPKEKPRYCMGVGYAVDLVVCSALGVDMYDCVFPTRTARFGTALVKTGSLKLTQEMYKYDFSPIEDDCNCFTCSKYSRAYLNEICCHEPLGAILLSIHNVAYQLNLMSSVREAIRQDRFPSFVQNFMKMQYPNGQYPQWAVDALLKVGVSLEKMETS